MHSTAIRRCATALLIAIPGLWLLGGTVWGGEAPPARNEVAIAEVASGLRATADASWWGFDPADSTQAIQAAIDSRASRVVIPMMDAPWVSGPVHLRSALELEFQPGVLVLAKPGAFLGGGDSLFSAVDRTNIIVRGHGAVWRMRKKDYQNPPYAKAEWRMGLSLTGCRNVLVEGLRIEGSGGDGIYVGSSRDIRWSENVTIRNCICHDNHRQGISVVSAENLLIENCVLSGTAGTPPEAGIDFEPDLPDERVAGCVVRNCLVESNRGNGLLVYLKPLTSASHPVSIRFEHCHVRMGPPGVDAGPVLSEGQNGWSGIAVGKVRDGGPQGLVEFVGCTSENTGREAVRIFDKAADGVRVRFERCRWRNSWVARFRDYGGPRVPILIRSQEPELSRTVGGVEFVDCHVFDSIDGPAIRFEDDAGRSVLRGVSGTVFVLNRKGAYARFGPNSEEVTLRVVDAAPKDGK